MSELESSNQRTEISVFQQAEVLQPLSSPVFDVLRHHFEISAGYSVGRINVNEPEDEMILSLGLSMVHRASGMKVFRLDEVSVRDNLAADLRGGLNMSDSADWKALNSLKKSAEENMTILHFIAITLLAAEHMPDTGYDGEKVPKPSKGREDTSHKIFRTSIEFLRRQATGNRLNRDEKDTLLTITPESLYVVATSDSELGEKVRKGMTKISSMLIARDILTSLQIHSPQQIQDDLNRAYRAMLEKYNLGIHLDETGWEILPMEEIIGGNGDFPDDDEDYISTPKYVDWARIRKLRQHIRDWPGAYMAVASLESQGEEEYYVAVLPARVGQLAVEHAIGDNPSSGNAIYAWRAEKGLDVDNVAVTWRGVYRQTKRMARALGARRMLHTENFDWNIMDYLTRPTDKLDEPGYSYSKPH